MRSQKISGIDLTLIGVMLFNVFFLRYLKPVYETFYYLDILILAYVVVNLLKEKIKIGFLTYLSTVFAVIVIALNLNTFGLSRIAVNNLLMAFMPATFLIYLMYLKKRYSTEQLISLASKLRLALNLFFIINTPIIILQIQTGTFMMQKFIAINPLVFDHMTGLVGLSGVSVLNFLWIATLLLNLYHFLERRKLSTLILIIAQAIIMTAISTFNDNKMFVMTLFMFVIVFFMLTTLKNKFTLGTMVKAITFIVVILGALWTIASYTDSVDTSRALTEEFFSSSPSKYNERAYLNWIAFKDYDAKNMGVGLNTIDIAHQKIHKHLTINSSGLLMMQGGIIYLAATIIFYCTLIQRLFKGTLVKKTIIFLMLICSLTVMAFATQIFRDQYIATATMMIYFALYLTSIKQVEIKEKVVTLEKKTGLSTVQLQRILARH